MSKTELKSYDIASFDIELVYNKKIAPIIKKVTRLNKSHESKSLRAHKDFLKKEKKSKEKLSELSDKAVIKNQKIEKAVENKVKKIKRKEMRIKKEFDEFVQEKTELANVELAKIDKVTDALKLEEIANKDDIKIKYKTNIESYVEKLDIYNNNFENNKQYHVLEIKKHQDILNQNIADLELFNKSVLEDLEKELSDYLVKKENSDNEVNTNLVETNRNLSNLATTIRKNSNLKITELDRYIEAIKNEYESHIEPNIINVNEELTQLRNDFEERRQLIELDLEINIKKLEAQLEEIKEENNKKAEKNILMKINLFNLRATTTIKYEENILNEKLLILEKEKLFLEESLRYELLNLDKLHIFLINDENELKETGDYFKELNLNLKIELNNFELSNNDYLIKHEQLKSDFIKNYTKIFSDLKESTIMLAQAYLEKIADNNHEIDEINKFLDTAEPLKEIEVSRLRENIEISEVTERYKIKYSKQDYETKIVNNDLNTEKTIENLKTKERLSETNKEVVDIKNKEVFDKALEKAKLKHSKALEIYNLRLNNTKLERNLLKNKYDTEIDISVHTKELAQINIRKHNALIAKEIEYDIKNHIKEANYKMQVVNKSLEEDLLKLEENLSKAKYEKDSYSANLDIEINLRNDEFESLKEEITNKAEEKNGLISQALERELKEPSQNMLKTETIIDERLSKLDINNGIFVDFINDSIDSYKDNKLTLEQIREIIIKNEIIFDKSTKYINKTYAVLIEAVKFMNDIEKRALLNKIASSSEQSSIKKSKKQLQKLEQEIKKQNISISKSETDHKVLIKNYIVKELKQLQKGNPESVDELVLSTEKAYNKIFNHLKDLQINIKKEITVLYSPLTKNEIELINHANINAEKAFALVEKEKQELLSPIDKEKNDFIKNKEELRNEFISKYDKDINELRSEINHRKNEALSKISEIKEEKTELVQLKQQQKQTIEETEEKNIAIRNEEIDQELKQLLDIFNQALNKLKDKDLEAKKIFDYEDRIYNIAVESATSRYNDSLIKAKNLHLNNVKQYNNKITKTTKEKDQKLKTFSKDLLKLTKQFEKNIFTVRPRLEESIGDAQKAIDHEIKEKEEHLNILTESNNKIILSAETTLFAAFQEGYDRLSNNLQNYIEKYRVIETEYLSEKDRSNNVLNSNNIAFNNALFELNKNKHAKTLKELLNLNKVISRREE